MNNQLRVLSLVILFFFFHVKAQSPSNPSSYSGVLKPLRPSLAVVVGITSIMLSVTFLVLAYAKFCRRNRNDHSDRDNQHLNALIRSRSRFSGIDRAVIDSLPFFRFSSLKGSKQGLECSVCLSRFEETEILRLLPKCKHAFHQNCIDQWLESHSSCPLCRYKFDPDNDLKSFSYSNRDLQYRNPSNLTDDPNLELFIQREEDYRHSSSRFNLVSSSRGSSNKQELLLADQESDNYNNQQFLHKLKHKIIVSDVIIKNRWSDVNSSDLLSLNSEMLSAISSNRFSNSRFYNSSILSMNEDIEKIKEDILERKRLYHSKICSSERSNSFSSSYKEETYSKIINHGEERSMSEITICSRFKELNTKSNKSKELEILPRNSDNKEDEKRRLWLPIVRRTVQWFAGEEGKYKRQTSNV